MDCLPVAIWRINMLLQKFFSFIGFSLFVTSVHSAGFQLQEQSVSGLGRAFAGDAAIADNASSLGRNPALGVLLNDSQISLGFSYIDPNIDVNGQVSGVATLPANDEDIAPSALVPYAYYLTPINEKMVFGLSLNSYFGLKTDYSNDFTGLDIADEAEITTVYITPSLSWKVNEQLNIGLGINFVYVDASISNAFPDYLSVGDGDILTLEGDDTTFGWHLGAVWQFNPSLTMGLSYRSQVDVTLEGRSRSDNPGTPFLNSTASLSVDLPETTEVSLIYDLDKTWMISFSVALTGWRVFDGLVADLDTIGTLEISDAEWDDSFRYALGITRLLSPQWTLRAGIALDEIAAPAGNRRLSIPDADREWFSFGSTYSVNQRSSIDFAVTYLSGDDVSITDAGRSGSTFTGQGGGDVLLLGASYNHRF